MLENIVMTMAFLVVGFYFVRRALRGQYHKKDALGIQGTLIWLDQGRSTRPFFNKIFKVFGKPDYLYRLQDGSILAVEYKHRNQAIYDSDIVQALAAALAARGEGYRVYQIMVKTISSEKLIDLPRDDVDLYKLVSQYVNTARETKAGFMVNPDPLFYKCKACAYRELCEHSAA